VLDAAAAVFGAGVGLTVDEFALWLHLEDVYWADQGRKSVDAMFCVLVITGALIGGTGFVTGYDHRHQERWNRLRDMVAGAPSKREGQGLPPAD